MLAKFQVLKSALKKKYREGISMKALYIFRKFPALFLSFITIAASCAQISSQAINADSVGSGTISDRNLGEVSGIAASRIHEDILWVINDSGNSASVYALNSRGELISTLTIQGVSNNDWEDVASFEYKGKAYILIADVGDNFAKRSKCFLHFIEEPDIKNAQGTSPLSVKPSWSITYTYEDGPRDCESVAVDVVNEKILLLSKRDSPPVLYELPLTNGKNAVAKKCAAINPLPQRIGGITAFSNYSNQPTAMDISADGSSAVVLTYGSAFYFRKKKSSDWSTVFLDTPEEIRFPPMRQAESICFSKDGSTIYITSEQLPAPLIKLRPR
jgi:hypothetical protein